MIRFFKWLLKESVRATVIPLFLFGTVVAALAFSEPTSSPTGGTVYAPINTGNISQTKNAGLTVSGTLWGSSVVSGSSICLPAGPAGGCITSWPTGGVVTSGVSQIIAGPGVTISPPAGTGVVTITAPGGGGGVTSINGVTGALTFNGSGVNQSGTTFTFPGGGGGVSQILPGTNVTISPPGGTGVVTINASGGTGTSQWATSGANIYNTNPGNVGIGRANPQKSLDVQGSILSSRNLYVQSPLNQNIIVGVGELQAGIADWPGKTLYGIGWDSNSGAVGVLMPSGATFGIYAGGGQGHLYVSGNLTVNQNITAGGYQSRAGSSGAFSPNIMNTYWTGSCAQQWVDTTNIGNLICLSDARLKANIQRLTDENGLAAISKLHPVAFEWKNSEQDAGVQFGFVAQDMQQVFPELVRNTGMKTDLTPDGMLTIDKMGLLAPAVKAIQELDARTQNQQKEIESLKSENAALKTRVESLEKK